jgi:hypothetical protein
MDGWMDWERCGWWRRPAPDKCRFLGERGLHTVRTVSMGFGHGVSEGIQLWNFFVAMLALSCGSLVVDAFGGGELGGGWGAREGAGGDVFRVLLLCDRGDSNTRRRTPKRMRDPQRQERPNQFRLALGFAWSWSGCWMLDAGCWMRLC